MKPTILLCLAVVLCGLLAGETATAGDWPMYRADAGRRGITQDSLSKNLSLAWSRQLPILTPAFKDARLQFDAGHEPLVANGVLLLASSRTDSVKAYETKTGKEQALRVVDQHGRPSVLPQDAERDDRQVGCQTL